MFQSGCSGGGGDFSKPQSEFFIWFVSPVPKKYKNKSMTTMKAIFNILHKQYLKYKKLWELNKYDEYTIAEYLRKRGVQIGENCRIISTNFGTEPYLVKLGNHVTIAGGVQFMTHNGAVWIFREEYPDIHLFGTIEIKDNCVIGENAIILPNVTIGPNSVIGAGSVVITDIPPNSIALGVPARVWGSIEKFKEKVIKEWKRQKPPDIEIEPGANCWNSKHYSQNVEKLKNHLISLFWNEKD